MTESVVLTGGLAVTSLSPPAVVSADVVIAEGRIASVGESTDGGTRIDCAGCLVIPGNVCAHHHLYSSLARGMPYRLQPPMNFVDILRRIWWRLDCALDARMISASAAVGGAEALLAGTTTVVDHHASPNAVEGSLDLVADALETVGVRSILCYEVSDRDGPATAEAGIDENRRFLKEVRPMSRGMVGAHASFTLSEETLAACVELARTEGVGLHVHVAEDEADQRDAIARFGRPVAVRLADEGAVDERSVLAHCIHLSDDERGAIRDAGATAVHNPRSNMNNRVGHAAVRSFDRLALGTDGIDGDLFAEGRAAFWRAREADPSIEPGWVLGRLAESARGAGRAFGEPLLGRIEAGAPADVVVLDYDPPTPVDDETLAGHWVFGISAARVRDVVVDGRVAVRERTLTTADHAEIAQDGRRHALRLWQRMDEMGEHPFEPQGA